MERLFKRLETLFPEMVEIRRKLHQEPELSFQEVKTPAFIADYLENLGIRVRRNVGGRGVVGYIEGGLPGKTVALRADFDALPIGEETGLPFASKNKGVMHACGHDGHTATLLVLAKALVEYREQIRGNVVLIHQFAEELAPGGAIAMIEDGCLDGVDAIFGTHLWTPFPIGKIGYRSGPIAAAADRFEIEVKGRGGHGAIPHETVDSIVIASSIVCQLQQIVSRNIDPLQSAVVSVGSFHAGKGFNVIADSASISGTVRTFDPSVQEKIIKRIEEIANGICQAMGAEAKVTYSKGYPAVVTDEKETERFTRTMKESMKDVELFEMNPEMVGEDFAYYLKRVPGTFFFTGAGNEEKGIIYPHHHPKFNIDEDAMLIAAKSLATVALDYLNDQVGTK